jgi:hypothetical protein
MMGGEDGRSRSITIAQSPFRPVKEQERSPAWRDGGLPQIKVCCAASGNVQKRRSKKLGGIKDNLNEHLL